ncbi:MAG: nucleoside triphosphate pyrophosphohydrolase family protein [Elusimicrobiota bacterium]
MDFRDYQIKASKTAIYLNKFKEMGYEEIPATVMKYLGISYCANGLGEVGEIQGKVKKILRDQGGEIKDSNVEDLKKELGDVLWYVAAMCTELGISMDDVAQGNIDKLFSRKERGQLKGSGDDR